MSRDASYTTQPLELLNDLGFGNSKNHTVLMGKEAYADDSLPLKSGASGHMDIRPSDVRDGGIDHDQEVNLQSNLEESAGMMFL